MPTIPDTEFSERLLLAFVLAAANPTSAFSGAAERLAEDIFLYALLDLQTDAEALYFEECLSS